MYDASNAIVGAAVGAVLAGAAVGESLPLPHDFAEPRSDAM